MHSLNMFQYCLYLFAYWINIYKNINSGWKQNKASWEILLMLNFYTFLAKLLIEVNKKKKKRFLSDIVLFTLLSLSQLASRIFCSVNTKIGKEIRKWLQLCQGRWKFSLPLACYHLSAAFNQYMIMYRFFFFSEGHGKL